jgi:hypothetical protein
MLKEKFILLKKQTRKKEVLQTTLIKKCGDIKHSGENGKFNQTKIA